MNKNYGMFGIALQPSSTAVAPAVSFPASSDSPGIDSSTSSEAARVTNGKRDTTIGRYISGVESKADVTTLGFADMLGLLLYAALGSITTTGGDDTYAKTQDSSIDATKTYYTRSGSGTDESPYEYAEVAEPALADIGTYYERTAYEGPWTHDIKMGESLPALTFTQQVGASNAPLQTLDGCKVDNVTIEAEGTTPPSVHMELAGCAAKWLASTTSWNGPEFDGDDGFFRTTDATVLFSLTDGNAAAVPSEVILSKIALAIANNVTAGTNFGKVEPGLQQEGASTVTCTIEGTSSSTSLYRAVKTGSSSGTEISKAIVTGALQVTFQHSKHADWTFTAKLPAIPWSIEAMNVSVEGGPFDLRLSTDGAIAVDGTSIEFLLANGTASYTD